MLHSLASPQAYGLTLNPLLKSADCLSARSPGHLLVLLPLGGTTVDLRTRVKPLTRCPDI